MEPCRHLSSLRRTLAVIATTALAVTAGQLPRFEDYPVETIFAGTPVAPRLATPNAQMFRTRIREGVEKGWGVYHDDLPQEKSRLNFAGQYIVIRWGCGSPCVAMAIVDAKTGMVSSPPVTSIGVGKDGFYLPLLTLGLRVSRPAEVEYRLDSRLMIIRATPVQSETHPSYEYYFLREKNSWSLLRRVPLREDTRLKGDP